MQTITTKYHGPTNTTGSRISATSTSGIKVYNSYDYSLGTMGNHKAAAQKLIDRLGWTKQRYAIGETKTGYVFVIVHDLYTMGE